jgi:hypothetical protein
MRDRYHGIRFFAANSLHQLGARTPAVLREFLMAIRSRDRQMRLVAAGVLSDYGARARAARRLFLRRLRDKFWDVRLTSAEALVLMDPADPRIRAAIERQMARDPEAHMHHRFGRILSYRHPRG